MTVKGAVAAILLVTLAGTWWWVLSEPTFRPHQQPPAPPRVPTATAVVSTAPRVDLERLDAVAVAPDRGGRDPFTDRARREAAQPAGDGPHDPGRDGGASMSQPEAVPRWPALRLIGIGASRGEDGPERLAIFAGERGVVHARAGDVVEEVYRVDAVHDVSVDVTLLPEGRPLVVRLPR